MTGEQMTDGVLTEREAAQYLAIPAGTLHRWRARDLRRGPRFIKVHTHAVRYRLRDLEVFLEARTIRPGLHRKEDK